MDLYCIVYKKKLDWADSYMTKAAAAESEDAAINTVDSICADGAIDVVITNITTTKRDLSADGCPWKEMLTSKDGRYAYWMKVPEDASNYIV